MTAQPEVTAADLLAEEFPGWTIWRSDGEHWYATRHTWPTQAEGAAGCVRTVTAPTPADLSRKLADQAKCTQKAAEAVP